MHLGDHKILPRVPFCTRHKAFHIYRCCKNCL